MSQTHVPGSVEELLTEYDRYITGTIVKLTHGTIHGAELADLKQQVALRLLQTDYLHKYNPDLSKWTTYLFWLIRSVVVAAYERQRNEPSSNGQQMLLTEGVLATDETGAVAAETLRDLIDDRLERQELARDLVDKLAVRLDEQAAPENAPLYRKRLPIILSGLRAGSSIAEIATGLGMSPSNVYGCLRYIRREAVALGA